MKNGPQVFPELEQLCFSMKAGIVLFHVVPASYFFENNDVVLIVDMALKRLLQCRPFTNEYVVARLKAERIACKGNPQGFPEQK